MLLKPLSWWCSPLLLTSTALLSVLGEGSLTCGSLWGFYVIFTLFKVFLVIFLTLVEGRWYHTLLKPCETNCDLWIWAIQIKFDWLIDWRLHTDFGHSFSPQAQGRAQLPLTQKGNQGTVVSPYPQEFLFFKTTLLQESHNSLCYRSGIPSLQLNKPQKCWDNWVFSVVSTLSQPPGT